MHRLMYCVILLTLPLAGCGGGGEIEPEPRPGPQIGPGTVVHRTLNCGDGGPIWHSYSDDPGGWFWVDADGQRQYGTPPCLLQGDLPQNVPNTRAGLGLVPDAEGNIAPLMWALDWNAQSDGRYSVEDRFNLFIASEANWELPFDTDPDLLAAIGAESISFNTMSVLDSGADPILVGFYQIRLGDAIVLLDAMGISQVTAEYSGQSYVLTLDGSPADGYTSALVYVGDDLVATFELQ